jgi:hypothetical protein
VKEPLRVAVWLGIGDCHWVSMKLRALSRLHGGRPVHVYVNESPNHASVGYLELVPFVDRAFLSEDAIYNPIKDLEGTYKAERWSTLDGCAGWRGFDYVLIANGHLERGERIETWLPELATDYSYELLIPEADRAYARSLAAPGSVLLYPSGTGANRGFHRDWWTVRAWADVIRQLNALEIVPVLVGANSSEDRAYRDRLVHAARGLSFVDTVGKTNIPQVCAMIEDAAVWCGLNSGLGIVSAMRQTPTLMMWSDARYPIRRAAPLHPAMQRSWLSDEQLATYRTLSYGSRALTPAAVVSNILELRRAPAEVAA